MRLLPFEEIYSLNYYDEFMGAEIEFIDNFGWRMIDHLTPNLISVFSCVFISPVLKHITEERRIISYGALSTEAF